MMIIVCLGIGTLKLEKLFLFFDQNKAKWMFCIMADVFHITVLVIAIRNCHSRQSHNCNPNSIHAGKQLGLTLATHRQDARPPPIRDHFLSCKQYVKVVATFYFRNGQHVDSNQVSRELRQMIDGRMPSAKADCHPLSESGMIRAMNGLKIELHHVYNHSE